MLDIIQGPGFLQNPMFQVGSGFDWDGEEGEGEWPIRLRMLLKEMGYPASADEYPKWRKDVWRAG